MPQYQVLPTDSVYLYDGSLVGFYCCVFESVYLRELPLAIETLAGTPRLFATKWIESDPTKARRVQESLAKKISSRAERLIETVFLSCMPEKELNLLRFLLFAYKQGGKAINMLGHPLVAPILAAERHLLGEAHLWKGFLRFADYGGRLAATINPKNFVLPYIANHFCLRYSQEDFLIFDSTHQAALLYENRQRQLIRLENLQLPPLEENEQQYQALWKRFYDTVAIEARENPRCRMTLMPKRYWKHMPEMQDQF
jgi:probable DNA metabolism protein